ncbi:uncharacterized protein At4g06744-like [Mercurialis annua]|uniref:uncharacterized protein At4g06744-like n=1 Tax=Mercurialis annua TaxID=3986 RepID=UPI0021606463|nr:uncharacterized protein At4g06744-like [Mercurialis annua]
MNSISCYSWFLIFTLIFHSCFIYEVSSDDVKIEPPKREALEIIIGGGGSYTPPAPPPEDVDGAPSPVCPPPPPPPPMCPPPPPPMHPPPPPPMHPPPPPPMHPPPPPPRPPSPPHLPPNIIRDYNTIQRFKKTITDDPFHIIDSWKEGVFNVCASYQGFACDIRPDNGLLSVAAADFNGYNFNGPNFQLKYFLDHLFDLALFHANSNNFTGGVPQGIDIKNINFFYELDLSNNKFSGGFPMSVLQAKNLTFLDIRFNTFYGSIPSQVFDLDLDVIFLNNNQFDQNIPGNIGNTPALYLTFANNRFTGEIPRSIGRAKNLLEVLFLNNKLTGCLPYEIGFLRKTTVFDVSCNKLTGPIPHSFGCLAKIEYLNLAKNQFYGPVPEMVCTLLNLRNFSLAGNYFTQVGPECRKLIRMKILDIKNNCILGLPNQRSPEECTKFFSTPKQCANDKSMLYIPCQKKGYLSSSQTVYQQSAIAAVPAAAPPRSYDALAPDSKIRFEKRN